MIKALRDFLGRLFQKRSGDRELGSLIQSAYGPAGVPWPSAWTDRREEQVKHFKYWVYVAIDAIASKVAEQTPNVSWVDDTPDRDRSKRNARFRRKALTPLLSHESLTQAPNDHPLVRLLKDPNEPDTGFDLWYETVMFLKLTGNAYWWAPPRSGRDPTPDALWVLPSHWVRPVWGAGKGSPLIEAWDLWPVEGHYLRRRIDASEVIHIRHKSPVSKVDGQSPLSAIPQWPDIQEAVNTAQWSTYKQGTFPTCSVQFDANMVDPNPDQLGRIEQKFFARYGGEHRAGKPLFLPPGVKVVPLTITPNQMLFGDTAEETRDKILAAFRVPAAVAGLGKSLTYGAIRAALCSFCTFALNPLCNMLGQTLTEKLARRWDETLRIWWEDFTPDDPAQLEAEIRTDSQCGAVTPNEIRVMRGREPLPEDWADTPVRPANMLPGSHPGGANPATPPPTQDQRPDYPDKE